MTPIISSEKENTHQNLREGETANLTCNATGFPEPTITWYRVSEMDKEGNQVFLYLCMLLKKMKRSLKIGCA